VIIEENAGRGGEKKHKKLVDEGGKVVEGAHKQTLPKSKSFEGPQFGAYFRGGSQRDVPKQKYIHDATESYLSLNRPDAQS